VQGADGTVSALLNNKAVNDTLTVNLNLGSGVSSVALVSLAAPNLFDSTGLTPGGATIGTDAK
jgi:hypothetical protein